MALNEFGLNLMIAAYEECALWSSTDDSCEPLDSSDHEVSSEATATFKADCRAFLENAESLIDGDFRQAGHDFWLTRNGHGAGFWDGDWPEPAATELDKLAKGFRTCDLYVGDDGLIYAA